MLQSLAEVLYRERHHVAVCECTCGVAHAPLANRSQVREAISTATAAAFFTTTRLARERITALGKLRTVLLFMTRVAQPKGSAYSDAIRVGKDAQNLLVLVAAPIEQLHLAAVDKEDGRESVTLDAKSLPRNEDQWLEGRDNRDQRRVCDAVEQGAARD